MDATEAARREAERIHQAAVAAGDDPWNLLELVSREAARRDLDVYALPQGDSALKSGRAVFDSQAGSILYEDTGSLFDRAFLIAHELGHVVLEGGVQDVVTEEVGMRPANTY
ncbi:ImmA/IrrE family metallo-endopeptidase [Rhodoferax ferrireducens]|uniref:ImmA/IrrE family metallo-endopeptidase n=1 Tax=Rhodoferax ferrireducens TaxID=192843 RepID=UPI001E294DE1|nr:ImmA/IrrE family metallo-endopeptidase [Rhodoferax ferrireducens]